jgi:dTDP-4-amino-4,6-dideoxygalactose transaminase
MTTATLTPNAAASNVASSNIPILDLKRQYQSLCPQMEDAILAATRSGQYILGPGLEAFESEIAAYLGAGSAIGCASGSDALYLALRALAIGPGDEVITTAMSYVATSESIVRTGATPVFVDIDPATFNLNVAQVAEKISPRTKALLPVHLFGQSADMTGVMALAKQYDLSVIEDCAQAIGAHFTAGEFAGRKVGTIGDFGCFSFFPSKNLGAYGDGGLMTTNNPALAERARMLRVHGQKERYNHVDLGINSRLDALQAAILRVKLPHLDSWNAGRNAVADRYDALLQPLAPWVTVPQRTAGTYHVFHQYTIRLQPPNQVALTPDLRNQVQADMAEAGIQTMIYYPIPLYAQGCHANLGLNPADYLHCEAFRHQVMSLPMFPELTADEQARVVQSLQVSLEKRLDARLGTV